MLPVIGATPGVRRLLAAAWKAIIETEDFFATTPAVMMETVLDTMSLGLKGGRLSTSNFEEVAGGTVHDICTTIIRQCSRAAVHGELAITRHFLASCFAFLHPWCVGSVQLQSTLASLGFIAPLTNALSAILTTTALTPILTTAYNADPIELCLDHLMCMLENPTEIASAIEAGLLRVTIAVAASISRPDRNDANRVSAIATDLLREILPRSLFHYTVLVQVRKCMHDCSAFAIASKIEASAFAQDWKAFSALAAKRLEFMQSWEAGAYPSRTACANMECGQIAAKRNFRTCSACRSVDYCSGDCQSVHWHSAHRHECNTLRSRRLSEDLCTRGRSFRKALLNADYRSLIANICLSQVLFMHEHPGDAFFTILMYDDVSGVGFGVAGVSQLKKFPRDVPLEEEFAKVARSGGRIEPHIVLQRAGCSVGAFLIPMHLAKSELHDGLRRIVRLLPPGIAKADAVESVKGSLRTLLVRLQNPQKDLVFTH
ncbi:hypothetical protein C8R46DRAFT_1309134 [Mycena filopes]|nr:hypothetical protein C8R46DRAFT_1309134 [Mycena filopes]